MKSMPIVVPVEPQPSHPAARHASPIEQQLCAMWAETLGLGSVCATDDFFELGGDSLLAIHLVGRIERELGVSVPAGGIFTCPTAAALARLIDGEPRREDGSAAVSLDEASFPLLPIQEHLLARRGSVEPRARMRPYLVEISGEVNETALVRAIDAWAQQDTFRLRLRHDGSTWRQHYRPAMRYDYIGIEEWDTDGAGDDEATVRHLAERCWELGSGRDAVDDAPLRLAIVRCGGRLRYVVCLVDPLVMADVSWSRLVEDLRSAYDCMRERRAPSPPSTGAIRRWADLEANRAYDERVTRRHSFWRLQWQRASRQRRGGPRVKSRAEPRHPPDRTAFATEAVSAPVTRAVLQCCAHRRLAFDELCLGTLLWALRSRTHPPRVLVCVVDRGGELPTIYPALLELPRALRQRAFIHHIGAQHKPFAERRGHYGALRYLNRELGSELAAAEDWSDAIVFECSRPHARGTPMHAANGHAAPISLTTTGLALDIAYRRLVEGRMPDGASPGRPEEASASVQVFVIGQEIHLVLAFDPARRDELVMRRWLARTAQGLGRFAAM